MRERPCDLREAPDRRRKDPLRRYALFPDDRCSSSVARWFSLRGKGRRRRREGRAKRGHRRRTRSGPDAPRLGLQRTAWRPLFINRKGRTPSPDCVDPALEGATLSLGSVDVVEEDVTLSFRPVDVAEQGVTLSLHCVDAMEQGVSLCPVRVSRSSHEGDRCEHRAARCSRRAPPCPRRAPPARRRASRGSQSVTLWKERAAPSLLRAPLCLDRATPWQDRASRRTSRAARCGQRASRCSPSARRRQLCRRRWRQRVAPCSHRDAPGLDRASPCRQSEDFWSSSSSSAFSSRAGCLQRADRSFTGPRYALVSICRKRSPTSGESPGSAG